MGVRCSPVSSYPLLRRAVNGQMRQTLAESFGKACKSRNILNARRAFRVAAPSIRIVPWAALASCWPLPQQLLPVSATGGGRRRCSGKIIFICSFETPAEFGGAKPRHLLTQTTPLLESPTGAFIAAQPQPFRNYFFTGGVVEGNGRYCAAFCESAALRGSTASLYPHPALRATFPRLGEGFSGRGTVSG